MSKTILAIDTATEAFSVALQCNDECREVFAIAPREHATRLLPTVHQLLAEAQIGVGQLDALVVTRGPGSFTGVRIGIAAAQGLALGTDLGLIAVSTLQALAMEGHKRTGCERILPLLDARMEQVYTAQYDFSQSGGVLVQEERVCDPQRVIDGVTVETQAMVLVGPGAAAYREVFDQDFDSSVVDTISDCYPHAAHCIEIAQLQSLTPVAADAIEPAYLRAAVR